MPFNFKAWTDPQDVISAYADAKRLSEYDFNVLTWNKNMTRSWALGQAFDQSFVYTDIERQRQYHSKDYTGHEEWPTPTTIERGWSNTTFSIREYWNKYAYYDDYYHPDQYIYEWTSDVDSLVF